MRLIFRAANERDLRILVELLADDRLGMQREDISEPLNPSYAAAFRHITADPNNELTIVEAQDKVVGMMQLTFIPYLTHVGSWRCLIEGVRIHKEFRGRGLGKLFFEWAIKRARRRGCRIVQLTSDKQRPDAIRFYEDLGFEVTHEGLKLKLDSA